MSTNKTLLHNQLFIIFPTDKNASCLFAHFPSVFHCSYFSFFLRIFLYLCLFKTNLCFVCSFPWFFILLFCLFTLLLLLFYLFVYDLVASFLMLVYALVDTFLLSVSPCLSCYFFVCLFMSLIFFFF
jgi:hypothetical protein